MKLDQEDLDGAILAWDATPTKYLLCKKGWWRLEALERVAKEWLHVTLVDQEGGEPFVVTMHIDNFQQAVDRLQSREIAR